MTLTSRPPGILYRKGMIGSILIEKLLSLMNCSVSTQREELPLSFLLFDLFLSVECTTVFGAKNRLISHLMCAFKTMYHDLYEVFTL